MSTKIALSIAGSDSGSGAGIQADLKTFSALGIYGCTAITALTAQNTQGVASIHEVPSRMVIEQIGSVMSDMPPSAIKIGMVYSRQVIDSISETLEEARAPIVLDPILAAGTGAKLLQESALDQFVSRLLPLATLVTPNRMEAEKLSGMTIKSDGDATEAAKKIARLGSKNVIVKGGHFGDKTVTDTLFLNRKDVVKIRNRRIAIEESHGSGCNFSAAVTAYLARGTTLEEACKMANEYVHVALENAVAIGAGLRVINPLAAVYRDAIRYRALVDLQSAVDRLISLRDFYKLIPETQTNFAYALPDASSNLEVAAVRGRLAKAGKMVVQVSRVEFGASDHMASAILAYMNLKPATRAVANFKFSQKILDACKILFKGAVSSYDRAKEPPALKKIEGSTISWGTTLALRKNPNAEIIYHKGDVGKEPMITVFGKNPAEVVFKIEQLLAIC